MVQTIIFSLDRAIQLELLLKSIVDHDREQFLDVAILFSYTSASHEESYQVLMDRYPQFQWVAEERFHRKKIGPLANTYWHNYYWWLRYKYSRNVSSNFRKQLIGTMRSNKKDMVMFLTDDSMFYRDIKVPFYPIEQIRKKPKNCSFSLRHGTNIAGGNFGTAGELLYWSRFDEHEHPEWSFPFSVDGHIYSKKFLLEVFSKVWFKNPNTLEGNIACYVRERELLQSLFANTESCLVGFELNRVQNISNNNNLNISNQYLNYLFNKGYRMKISFDGQANRFFRPDKFRVEAEKENYAINIITLS